MLLNSSVMKMVGREIISSVTSRDNGAESEEQWVSNNDLGDCDERSLAIVERDTEHDVGDTDSDDPTQIKQMFGSFQRLNYMRERRRNISNMA